MSDFREIPDAPGYSVNREGQVMGRQGRLLKPEVNPWSGKQFIRIKLDGRNTSRNIEKLVNEVFYENFDPWARSRERLADLWARVRAAEQLIGIAA